MVAASRARCGSTLAIGNLPLAYICAVIHQLQEEADEEEAEKIKVVIETNGGSLEELRKYFFPCAFSVATDEALLTQFPLCFASREGDARWRLCEGGHAPPTATDANRVSRQLAYAPSPEDYSGRLVDCCC